jgi:hypothetical protein
VNTHYYYLIIAKVKSILVIAPAFHRHHHRRVFPGCKKQCWKYQPPVLQLVALQLSCKAGSLAYYQRILETEDSPYFDMSEYYYLQLPIVAGTMNVAQTLDWSPNSNSVRRLATQTLCRTTPDCDGQMGLCPLRPFQGVAGQRLLPFVACGGEYRTPGNKSTPTEYTPPELRQHRFQPLHLC